MNIKEKNLEKRLRELKKVAVAFSGGVDSYYLLYKAYEVLGNNAIGINYKMGFSPSEDKDYVEEFKRNYKTKIIEIGNGEEWDNEDIILNSEERCYHCKKFIFENIKKVAKKEGFVNIIDGTNGDDTKDYRPGMLALLELEIISPLKDVDLRKKEIRELSKKYNLKTHNRNSTACLASRIPYGRKIEEKEIQRVYEGEKFLYKLGISQCRIRSYGDLGKIEINLNEIDYIKDNRELIIEKLKELGYNHITLDLEGFRSGSMNQSLSKSTIDKWSD